MDNALTNFYKERIPNVYIFFIVGEGIIVFS